MQTRTTLRLLMIAPAVTVAAWILFCSVHFANAADGAGDARHGETVFNKRCGGCHALDIDKDGPRLRGVFGRKAASGGSFKYSDALKKSGVTWDEQSLDKWLTDPDKFIADNDMDFHLAKADERADVIAYLKTLSAKP